MLWITGCAVAPAVLTATGLVNRKGQFSTPHRIDTSQPITKKFVTGDYVGDPYGCAKLGAYPSTGGRLGTWVKYNQNYFYLCPLFGNSPTGQTRQRILTHDSSNDADSRKDAPFKEFFYIASHVNGQIPPKTICGVNRRFQAKLATSKKRAYYQNYCIDFNQILHSDKDYQMPVVDCPDTRITNPRWRTAAILEKTKNGYISASVGAILTKFGTLRSLILLIGQTIKI